MHVSPSLYYFNPGHENALLNSSPYYTPPASVVKMQNDLAYICAWYSNEHDFVLVNNTLPEDFTLSVEKLNNLAKGITLTNLASIGQIIKQIHLWGISPQSIHKFEQINNDLSINLEYPKWNSNLIKLSSREVAQNCLTYLVEKLTFVNKDIVPIFFRNLEDIEKYVVSIKDRLIVKAPYSSSGRGLLWLPIGILNRNEKQIIHGMLKKQACISIEKALDKIIDFAMEFYISPQGQCTFTAYSLFYTNEKGSYSHNFIGSQKTILDHICQYIELESVNKVSELLSKYIENHFSYTYSGCIGVDMMIYREYNKYYMHPCVEINVRDNMGLIAHSISINHIGSNSQGYFYIDYKNKYGEQMIQHEQMQRDFPLIIENKKVKSGYMSLCPVTPQTNYRAYILIDSIV